jgi:hypothetical protein
MMVFSSETDIYLQLVSYFDQSQSKQCPVLIDPKLLRDLLIRYPPTDECPSFQYIPFYIYHLSNASLDHLKSPN